MDQPKEIYISVDVETSGPSVVDNSLLSIGACVVGARHKKFYVEMQPGSWEKEPDPKSMEVNGLDWKKLRHSGESIVVGMLEFRKFISRVAGGKNQKAVFVSFGTFDWNWVSHYLALTGRPNDFFGPNTLDLKSFYMGWQGTTWIGTRKKNMPKQHLAGRRHTHNALDDATEQAVMFEIWLKERSQNGANATASAGSADRRDDGDQTGKCP